MDDNMGAVLRSDQVLLSAIVASESQEVEVKKPAAIANMWRYDNTVAGVERLKWQEKTQSDGE